MPGFRASAVDGSPKSGLTCLHCELLLKEPVQTEEGYRLCRQCFKEIQSLPDGTCKKCQITSSESCYPDKAVQREVLALRVRCQHFEHGCMWEGALKEWEAHSAGCSFQGSPCPNEGCMKTLSQQTLRAHLEICPFRLSKCPHCSAEVVFSELESHFKVCEYKEVSCDELTCGQTFMRKDMSEHKWKHCKIEVCLTCQSKVMRDTGVELVKPNPPAAASYRGGKAILPSSSPLIIKKSASGNRTAPEPIFQNFSGPPDYTPNGAVHLSDPYENFRHHQDLALSVKELKREVSSTQESQKEVSDEWAESRKTITQLKSENTELKSELSELKQSMTLMKEKLQEQGSKSMVPIANTNSSSRGNNPFSSSGYSSASSHDQRRTEPEFENLRKEFLELQRVVDDIRFRADRGLARSGYRDDIERDSPRGTRGGHSSSSTDSRLLMAVEKRVEEIAKQLTQVKIHGQELELQLQASLASTHNGSFLWRIPEVSRRRRDAIDERVTSIYSPPFYTGRNGYKMCIRAYLNGDGMGYKTHLSLFFVLMRGECDPLLKWPFEYKVSMILVDQTHRKHIVQTFKPTPESSSFQQPQTDMNVASGCPQFAKLSVFDENCYVKNDVMFVKCIVDTTKIFHP